MADIQERTDNNFPAKPADYLNLALILAFIGPGWTFEAPGLVYFVTMQNKYFDFKLWISEGHFAKVLSQ